ncbi:MAG: FAD-dependent oxidoreductase [Sandaracinaceae bacterium]
MSKNRIDVDVAVIGAGPAGIAAAMEASRAGLAVAVVEAHRVGGAAAWHTQLPWRSLERAADQKASFASAVSRADALATRWEARQALRLGDAGCVRVEGHAVFSGPRAMRVTNGDQTTEVSFDHAVIATGAEPVTLEGDEPDGETLFVPSQLMTRETLPDKMLVVGGGAAGAELCDALVRLGGVELTWLMDDYGLLPRFDRELAEAFGDVLMERGVKLVHGKAVKSVAVGDAGVTATLDGGHTYIAPVAVLALGTRPRLDGLRLERAQVPPGPLAPDPQGRIAPTVFAVGTCTGRARSVAAAEAMGTVAGLAIAGDTEARFHADRIPMVARTRPLLAQVGQTPERVGGREVIFHTLRLESTIGGLLDGVGETEHDKGLLRVVCDSDTGEVLGGTAFGPGAEDTISAVALAMQLHATDEQLAELFGASPSHLGALGRAVR